MFCEGTKLAPAINALLWEAANNVSDLESTIHHVNITIQQLEDFAHELSIAVDRYVTVAVNTVEEVNCSFLKGCSVTTNIPEDTRARRCISRVLMKAR